MATPSMLDAIIASQKEKNPSANISKRNLEDSLSNVDTLSAADFKKLLAGESIQTADAVPASNVIDMALDIKKLTENSDTQVAAEHKNIEITENTNNNIEQMSSNIDKISDIQEDMTLSPEEKAEQIALIRDEIELLKQIESNTRSTSIVPSSSYNTGNNDQSSSMVPGLMGFLGGGLASGVGGMFAGMTTGAAGSGIISSITGGISKFIVTVFKGLLKGAVIFTIIGSIASGLIDGVEEYKKSGNLKEAIWAGLSGFVEFLSFGLVDKDDLESLMTTIKEKGIFGAIYEGWQKLYDFVSNTIDSIVEYITGTNLFQDIKDQYENEGIGAALWGIISKWFNFLYETIVDSLFGEGSYDSLVSNITEIWGSLVENITKFIDDIVDYIKNIVSSVVDGIKEKYTSAKTKVLDVYDNTKDKAAFLYGSAKDAVTGWFSGNDVASAPIEEGREYTINKSGVTYNITKEDHDNISKFIQSENPAGMNKYIEENSDRLFADPQNISQAEDAILGIPERTTADNVMKQSESNAALREAIAAPAPVIVNAPTNNTSMQHTTALPQVKPRDYDKPNLLNNYAFP